MSRLVGVLGVAVMLGLAVLLSRDRRRIPWRLVGAGLALQLVFGALVLRTMAGRAFFDAMGALFSALYRFQEQGARFVFGNLVQPVVPVGVPAAAGGLDTAAGYVAGTGAVIAFSVLPTIIFFAALTSVLYHLGLMQRLVHGIAWVMQRSLKTSGAETLSAAGEIFLGPTESPLLVKPYIARMTTSELFTTMACGLATVAGGVMAAYIGMLQGMVTFGPEFYSDVGPVEILEAVFALTTAIFFLLAARTDAGRTPVEIAAELREHVGKVELILNLRRSASGTR